MATPDSAATPPRYGDVRLGDRLPEFSYVLTQEVIDHYGLASLDLNPVHMDPAWAARAQVFGIPQTVGHGMMLMSEMTSVVLRGWGPLARITDIDSKFTKPIPVDTTVTVAGEVSELHPISDGQDFVVVAVTARDEAGDLVGLSSVQVALER